MDDAIGSNDHHYRYLRVKMNQTNESHGRFVTFTFCGLIFTFTFLRMIFLPIQGLPWTYNSTLREFELLASRLTDLRFRNVKTMLLDIRLDLDLARHIDLEMSSMDWVHHGKFIECRLACLATNLSSRDNVGEGTFATPPPTPTHTPSQWRSAETPINA